MTGVLDHPGQAFYMALMVVGVAGICVAVVQLWCPGPDRSQWLPWLLLAVAATVTVVAAALR